MKKYIVIISDSILHGAVLADENGIMYFNTKKAARGHMISLMGKEYTDYCTHVELEQEGK